MTKNLGGLAEAVLGQTLDELELSALQGCQRCWLHFNQITDEEKQRFPELGISSMDAGKVKLVTECL
jgi:hypothetical protein